MPQSSPIFYKDKGTILLPIDKSQAKIEILSHHAKAAGFTEKGELHVTLIGFYVGKKILDTATTLAPDQQQQYLQAIDDLCKTTTFNHIVEDTIYHVQKDYQMKEGGLEHRESYVRTVTLPQVEEFIAKLTGLTGLTFEPLFPHVTIFVKGTGSDSTMGIGIQSQKDFDFLKPEKVYQYSTIILPTRPQADTLVCLFILRHLGEMGFWGISQAKIVITPKLPDGKTERQFADEGILLLDCGGGRFDHHVKKEQTTLTDLIARYLNIDTNQALQKLFEYARRDDFEGKGTISTDALDRAFGLSGLITALNKNHSKFPEKVIDIVMPLLEAHYAEEVRRTEELPREWADKQAQGLTEVFDAKQRDKKYRCVIIFSDNISMAGFLRSQLGGRFDVVAQILSSGHLNILTRPTKRVDLRSLAALIRAEEIIISGKAAELQSFDMKRLATPGRIDEAPMWYYDTATNSLQNGGINPKDVEPTKVPRESLAKILTIGLSEAIWNPIA